MHWQQPATQVTEVHAYVLDELRETAEEARLHELESRRHVLHRAELRCAGRRGGQRGVGDGEERRASESVGWGAGRMGSGTCLLYYDPGRTMGNCIIGRPRFCFTLCVDSGTGVCAIPPFNTSTCTGRSWE